MDEELVKAIKKYAEGKIALHKFNVETYIKNPAGIGEHSDIAEAVVEELKKIAEYDDILNVLEIYF